MIIGHAAVAIWVKARRPEIPIAVLIVASYFADLLEAWLYWTHLPPLDVQAAHRITTLGWAAMAFGLGYGAISRRWGDALAVGAVVLSHWVLDVITGLKPTWVGGPSVGLCIYQFHAADFVIESLLLGAVWLSVRRRHVQGRLGDARLYVALMAGQFAADVLGAIYGGGVCAP